MAEMAERLVVLCGTESRDQAVRLRQSRSHDRFDFEEGFETEYTELAPDARLLVAPERRQRVVLHAVDRDASGRESTCDGLGMLGVRGEHVRMEAEDRVVRDGDGVVLIAI